MKHTREEAAELINPHWPRRPGATKVDIRDAWPHIEVGAGWGDVLWHAHHIAKDFDENYTVRQIKEKFGGLRFYADLPFVVECMIEALANNVCEVCGDFGNVVSKAPHGWLRNACKEHRGPGDKTAWEWKSDTTNYGGTFDGGTDEMGVVEGSEE